MFWKKEKNLFFNIMPSPGKKKKKRKKKRKEREKEKEKEKRKCINYLSTTQPLVVVVVEGE